MQPGFAIAMGRFLLYLDYRACSFDFKRLDVPLPWSPFAIVTSKDSCENLRQLGFLYKSKLYNSYVVEVDVLEVSCYLDVVRNMAL